MSVSIKYFFPSIITAVFFFASLILISGLVYFFYINSVDHLIQEKVALLKMVQRSVYDPQFYYRTFGAFPALKSIVIKEAANSPGVAFLRIIDPAGGKVVFSGKEEEIGKTLKGAPLFLGQPLVREGAFNGRPIKEIGIYGAAGEALWMGVDLKDTRRKAMSMVLPSAFLIFLVMIASYSLLYFIFRKSFLRPFGRIIEAIYLFGEGGSETPLVLRSSAIKEIGELSRALGKMTSDLKEYHEALIEAKTSLEIKVAARTEELRKLTQGLDAQVKEKTKEVYEKMEELERFNRLAIGRELKMVELKEKIAQLQKNEKKSK